MPKATGPRQILESLRNPSGESELLYSEEFLEDMRRGAIFSAMRELLSEVETRHLKRAYIAEQMLKGEKVEVEYLKEYGLDTLEYGQFFRVIAANVYSAMTHITAVLLELRKKPEGAVAGSLELLTEGQRLNKPETLENVLRNADTMAGKILAYEKRLFDEDNFISKAVSLGYCNGDKRFSFQIPMDEADVDLHWGKTDVFYTHHKGQWNEVNVARKQFEPICRQFEINLEKYRHLNMLYERFEHLR